MKTIRNYSLTMSLCIALLVLLPTSLRQSVYAVDCYDNADCELYEGGCPECSVSPSGNCSYEFDGQAFQHFTVEVDEEGFEHFAGYEPQVCFYYRKCKNTGVVCPGPGNEELDVCEQDTTATTFYFASYSNIVYWDECDN